MDYYLPVIEKTEEERPRLHIHIPPPEWYNRYLEREKEDRMPKLTYEVDYSIRQAENESTPRGVIIIEM